MALSPSTKKEIKLQAISLINKYSLVIPIDVYALAEKLNIYIQERNDVIGEGFTIPIFALAKFAKISIIIIEKDVIKTRKRFTIAHEIYHSLEHKNISFFSSDKAKAEREANIFATELLMPANQIKNSVYSPEAKNISELAYIFNVSKQAMQIRIKELNLDDNI